MILVDMVLPVDLSPEDLAAVVARWTQSVRHAVEAEGVRVGAARGVVLPIPAEHVLSGLSLASHVLTSS